MKTGRCQPPASATATLDATSANVATVTCCVMPHLFLYCWAVCSSCLRVPDASTCSADWHTLQMHRTHATKEYGTLIQEQTTREKRQYLTCCTFRVLQIEFSSSVRRLVAATSLTVEFRTYVQRQEQRTRQRRGNIQQPHKRKGK